MDLPSLTSVAALVVLLLGFVVVAAAARALVARHREAALGPLVAVDAGAPMTMRSSRYRISGRPDLVRRLPDGRRVPIELKSRPAPPAGPRPSHRIQVAVYCLLLEESTGVAPPFGVVRYGDGVEFRVPWNASARSELLRVRAELDRPYDGRATPSVAKCARCGWRAVCDARVRGG
jgi:CRISPR-associated exonuclease Cas4